MGSFLCSYHYECSNAHGIYRLSHALGISGVSAGTLGPIIYAVFSRRRASPRAAEASMIIGLISYLIIVFTGIESSPLAAGGWATVIGILIMFILANILKRPESRTS